MGRDDHPVAAQLGGAAERRPHPLEPRVEDLLAVLEGRGPARPGDPPARRERLLAGGDALGDPPDDVRPEPRVGVEDEHRRAADGVVRNRREGRPLAVGLRARGAADDRRHARDPRLDGGRAHGVRGPVDRSVVHDDEVEPGGAVGVAMILAAQVANERGERLDLVPCGDDDGDPGEPGPGAGGCAPPGPTGAPRPGRRDAGARDHPERPGGGDPASGLACHRCPHRRPGGERRERRDPPGRRRPVVGGFGRVVHGGESGQHPGQSTAGVRDARRRTRWRTRKTATTGRAARRERAAVRPHWPP